MKAYAIMFRKFNNQKRAGVMNVMQLLTLIVRKFQLEDYHTTERSCSHRASQQRSFVMEPSIPFHTVIELVFTESIRNENICTLHLPLETDIGRSRLAYQNFVS